MPLAELYSIGRNFYSFDKCSMCTLVDVDVASHRFESLSTLTKKHQPSGYSLDRHLSGDLLNIEYTTQVDTAPIQYLYWWPTRR